MRCKNCGWPNKPNETVCTKCHSPLTADDDNVEQQPYAGGDAGSAPLNKTVREDEVFGPSARSFHDAKEEYQQQESHRQQEETVGQCPKCGYPVRQEAERCPNCNFTLRRSAAAAQDDSHVAPTTSRRATRLNDGSNSGGKHRGTINPYLMSLQLDPTFTLKPLRRVNERHDYEEQEYEGDEVVLTRDNTEANNPSITSREQAVVRREGDHWVIEDRSEQKTTFVCAAHKIELHDGDIILLGNRLFEFHE